MSGKAALAFDTAALRAPVPLAAAKSEGDQRLHAELGVHAGARITAGAALRSAVLVIGAGVLSYFFLLILQMAIALFTHAHMGGSLLLPAAIVMVLPLLVARVRALTRARRDADRRWYRLSRFAEQNGLSYEIRREDPDESAQLFGIGSERRATDVVSGAGVRSFEASNYDYETWAARTRMPRSTTYVRFQARSAPPPFALLARDAPGGITAWQPRADQQEIAAIDARIRVFCAPQDKPAVRALLTGPVLDALVDVAGYVDIEVTGARIFFIARDRVEIESPAFWEWVEDLSALLDRHLDATTAPGVSTVANDVERAARRRSMFRPAGAGKAFVIGCLLPFVFGVIVVLIETLLAR